MAEPEKLAVETAVEKQSEQQPGFEQSSQLF